MRQSLGWLGWGLVGMVGCLLVASGAWADAGALYPKVESLASGSTTVVDEVIQYPEGEAEVRSLIVTLQPGEETGWHHHGVPLFGYILSGSLVVDYGPLGERAFKVGESLLEAINHPHNGRNPGTEPVRILVVYMSAKGLAVAHKDVPPGQ